VGISVALKGLFWRAHQVTWGHNANLGRYTNFVNLLDMAGIAVPSGLLHCALFFSTTR